MRVSLLLGLTFACGIGLAGVDMTIDEPEYWSHTNNRVIGHAHVTSGTLGLTAARIQIDGNTVWSDTYPAGPKTYVYEVNPKVMFDSTQWSNLYSLEVKLEVKTTDSPTVWHSISHTCLVKNRVGLYSFPDLQREGEPILDTIYGQLGYTRVIRHDAFTMQTYFIDVADLTAADLNTHADFDYHCPGEQYTIDLAMYSTPLSTKIGTGLPPFNSTKKPPLNFVHFNACNMGQSTYWVDVLYPKKNQYSGISIEDQATIVYVPYTLDVHHDEASDALSDWLGAGYVVLRFRSEMVNREDIYVRDTDPGVDRLIALADIVVLGDTATRLTTVYTGTHENPIGNVRVL